MLYLGGKSCHIVMETYIATNKYKWLLSECGKLINNAETKMCTSVNLRDAQQYCVGGGLSFFLRSSKCIGSPGKILAREGVFSIGIWF